MAISQPLSYGLGPLEAYVDAEEGVAFMADNGMFWSCILRGGVYKIEAIKSTKDPWCKFRVSKLPNGKVLLSDQRGVYLSRINRGEIDYIEASKKSPDPHCEFTVFTVDKKVVLEADNGKFVSRIKRDCQNIEAAKEGPDECCRFSLCIGDIASPNFKIIKIDFSKEPNLVYKPAVVSSDVFINRSNVAQKHTFTLTWETKVSETTSWKHAWGLSIEASSEVNVILAKATVSYNGEYGSEHTKEKTITQSRNIEITATVRYNGEYGTAHTKEKTITQTRSTEVTIQPKTKVTAKLVAYKENDAKIPFTATIKKIRAGGPERILTEEGTWEGVLYDNVLIDIEEEEL